VEMRRLARFNIFTYGDKSTADRSGRR